MAVTQGINLMAVYIADFVGVLLLGLILLARGWDLPGRRDESRILLILIIATIIDCLIDPFIFIMDGRPGKIRHAVAFIGNSALFLYNLIVGTGVMALIVKHINKKVSRFQYITVWIMTVMETALIVINFFTPVIFSIDENNVYSRGPLYFIYIAVAAYLLVYSMYVYVTGRIKDGSLRYFPVWEFTIPIVWGVTVQTLIYGVSTQPVSFALAFVSIVFCLQKEYLYVDKLTGVYNRYELEKIIRYYIRKRKRRFAALMLDMNGFKAINDDYSHKEGDEALKSMASILLSIVGNKGNVIRFAGDEFVVIMDSVKDDTVDRMRELIENSLIEYNARSGKPYKLSASVGGMIFETEDADDVINRIDRLMYDAKVEYYRTHDRRSVGQAAL